MNPIFDTYRPEGFHTLNGYLFLENPEELISFLSAVFLAEEISRTVGEDGKLIRNCILRIGDSSIMLAQASEAFAGMRTCFYLYVSDVDEVYQRAMDHGGQSVFPPADMDFGDRQGGIMDPAGNYWWISKRLDEGGYSPS
ncbi:MAG: VOC family protein [Bacteroidota bacterium]